MVAEDGSHMAAIERFIGRKIERVKLENFNYKYTASLTKPPTSVPPTSARSRACD